MKLGQECALHNLGLSKQAAHPLVEKYHKLLEALSTGNRAWHGTTPTNAQGIIGSGLIHPTGGSFGPGVYLWRRQPKQTWMLTHQGDASEGFGVPLARADEFRDTEAARTVTNPRIQREAYENLALWKGPSGTGTESFPLEPGDIAVVSQATANKVAPQLKKLELDQIEPALFQRAKADKRARGLAKDSDLFYPEDIPTPTARDLEQIIANPPPDWKGPAPQFMRQYGERVVGLSPEDLA